LTITPRSPSIVRVVLAHRFGGQTNHVEGADQIDADHAREGCQVMWAIAAKHFLRRCDTGTVHQSVQRSEFVDGQIDGGACAGLIGHIGLGKARVRAELRSLRLARTGIDINDHHLCTSVDQATRRFRSESGACTRYHKNIATDLHFNSQKNIATSRNAALLDCADGGPHAMPRHSKTEPPGASKTLLMMTSA
jgi:hypothetical protein